MNIDFISANIVHIRSVCTHRYDELCRGTKPRGISVRDKDKLFQLKNSMYVVQRASSASQLCPCDANPFELACQVCKSFAHDGICKHVLAITHIIMAEQPDGERNHLCNLNFMCKPNSKRQPSVRRAPCPRASRNDYSV